MRITLYGHGKYETLAAAIIGVVLAYVALRIAGSAIQRIFGAIHGVPIPDLQPLPLTAFLSFFIKEWLYQATTGACDRQLVVGGQRVASPLGRLFSAGLISRRGAAAYFGDDWLILDPIAALFVSIF